MRILREIVQTKSVQGSLANGEPVLEGLSLELIPTDIKNKIRARVFMGALILEEIAPDKNVEII